MQTHPYDILPLTGGGGLIFTPCPGTKGAGLEESLAQLKRAGAQAVISLTPSAEMTRLGVEKLPEACRDQDLDWFHLPVEDDSAPAAGFARAWAAGRAGVHAIFDRRGMVAIHCKGGSGRTGLMAAIILLERGVDRERATALVQGLRPKALRLQAHLDCLENWPDQRRPGGQA